MPADRKWAEAEEKERKKKGKRREEREPPACWWCVVVRPPFAVCHLRSEFSRATLPRVSYYLTLPYAFPLNREHCSANFIKATSLLPPFSYQCESHCSSVVLLSSMPRVPRVPRNFPPVLRPRTRTHAEIPFSFLLSFARFRV